PGARSTVPGRAGVNRTGKTKVLHPQIRGHLPPGDAARMIAEAFVQAAVRLGCRSILGKIRVEVLHHLQRMKILLVQRRAIDWTLSDPRASIPEVTMPGRKGDLPARKHVDQRRIDLCSPGSNR